MVVPSMPLIPEEGIFDNHAVFNESTLWGGPHSFFYPNKLTLNV